jgi:hypothetical protein
MSNADALGTIQISDLCAALAARTGSPPTGGHRRLQQWAADARLPTAHRIRGRWYVRADALDEIILALSSQWLRGPVRLPEHVASIAS